MEYLNSPFAPLQNRREDEGRGAGGSPTKELCGRPKSDALQLGRRNCPFPSHKEPKPLMGNSKSQRLSLSQNLSGLSLLLLETRKKQFHVS